MLWNQPTQPISCPYGLTLCITDQNGQGLTTHSTLVSGVAYYAGDDHALSSDQIVFVEHDFLFLNC
jgi:hypothetical protein